MDEDDFSLNYRSNRSPFLQWEVVLLIPASSFRLNFLPFKENQPFRPHWHKKCLRAEVQTRTDFLVNLSCARNLEGQENWSSQNLTGLCCSNLPSKSWLCEIQEDLIYLFVRETLSALPTAVAACTWAMEMYGEKMRQANMLRYKSNWWSTRCLTVCRWVPVGNAIWFSTSSDQRLRKEKAYTPLQKIQRHMPKKEKAACKMQKIRNRHFSYFWKYKNMLYFHKYFIFKKKLCCILDLCVHFVNFLYLLSTVFLVFLKSRKTGFVFFVSFFHFGDANSHLYLFVFFHKRILGWAVGTTTSPSKKILHLTDPGFKPFRADAFKMFSGAVAHLAGIGVQCRPRNLRTGLMQSILLSAQTTDGRTW